MNPLLQYWYFHLPNFIIAAVMYSVLGRLTLSFFVNPNWKNYIWRAFVKLTDPVIRLVRFVTPAVFPDVLVLVFAFFWLMAARIVLLVVLGNFGLLPTIAATGG
ncbi:MAG TPA: hypothetical protein VJ019_12565 [Aestuariivirga sp.]|nr:hypothetical protein [Aestuariivirga sp.]